MLNQREIETITRLQLEMQRRFRTVPGHGVEVEYLGEKFVVLPDVFWPFVDSQPLVENYVVHPGEEVLDIGTGTGVIAIFSAKKGARKVVALDISSRAVANARINADQHGYNHIIEVRQSDVFSALKRNEQFDVITANLPFRNQPAADAVEATQWDENFQAHKRFFGGVNHYLKPGGRIYLAQANFGGLKEMHLMAKNGGFSVRQIGQRVMPEGDPRIFYAFELVKDEGYTAQA
ncbi:MAG: tRNA (adenine(22)-N(1))-methyltransferase TrmK [Candidatus Kerfeldbacteria bacterium]|nr:tRNA (adenine(22)-N(1))-methyltransferase TrmK [Candidatus Kerfeldbacteria bacterium]